MSILICPNCKSELSLNGSSFVCKNGHSFDRAKQGYVNLFLTQQSSKKRHGDDRLMVKARTAFLSSGYYEPLLNELQKTVARYIPENGTLLDCGCGEGYYTNGISDYLTDCNKNVSVYGTDISKDAVIAAGRRNKNTSLFVASVAQLPVKTASVDIITSVFAPHCDTEFYRILKKDGLIIRVIPLENHLFSLKEAIYDNPYENLPDLPSLFGFQLSDRTDVRYEFTVPKEQLNNLFMMTPYYYKTSAEDQKKLTTISELTTTAEFAVLTYRKV